jgi:toxin ParE1/3/4
VTRITWAPQAVEDVEAIRAYVARDSAHYADLLVERIIAAVARLESHPFSGRVVPEVGEESIREIIQGSYRIVYRVNRDLAQVVTVFHGAALFRFDRESRG